MKRRRWLFTSAALVAGVSWIASTARADRTEPAPQELQSIEVVEHLDVPLPLDLPFVDSNGEKVRLGDFFDGKTPVILTLNYSDCPMLCSMQLTGLFKGLQGVDWNLGDQYRMVTVSIDPDEKPERAEATKKKYLEMYGRADVEQGWHCLTGEEANIRNLAGTVGFGYALVPETGEYAHAAVTMICTPDGRMSRYLYGIQYPPQTVRLALLEASEGKIGSTVDQILLYCFQYDPTSRQYGPAALKIMRAGGLVTLIFLAGLLGVYWLREVRKTRRARVDDVCSLPQT